MENETIDTEHKPLIRIEEYAAREGVSLRTAESRIRRGKVQAIRRNGKTLIFDQPTMPEPILTVETEVQTTPESQSEQIVKFDDRRWFELGALTVKAKSGQNWKRFAIFLTVLLIISTAAGITATGWFYINRQIAFEHLDKFRFQTAAVNDQLAKERTASEQAREKISALETELAQARERLSEAGEIQLDLTKTISGHSITITDQAEKIRELTKLSAWLEKQLSLTKAEHQAAGKTAPNPETTNP